jgi:anti-sigma B factor antagonist
MSETELTINVEQHKRCSVITIIGRIDSSNANELDNTLKELLNSGNSNLVLEMSSVEYMSSAGLRAIVSALREAKKKRGDVCIATPSERVAEVFSLAGLLPLFTIFDDVTSAVGSF